ncbi:MBL fold metallo-hydrolase [Bacillus haimaensis]|uniref:MBL fold metallo-hydrolase n=1 Tax=Bacillus haimaensis TaxID=3160967 RepID=UPI003AA8F39A
MENGMNYSRDNKFIPVTSIPAHTGEEVARDLNYYTNQVVNICLYGSPEQKDGWVLNDTGMPESADEILSVVEERFGPYSRPNAIILTHGHFDHVGASVDTLHQIEKCIS